MRRNGGRVRLDKFMKVSRLAKRRSEAHEALEHGRITRESKALKPGYQVKPGDVLEIHYATKFVTVRIREVPLRVTPGVKPADLYEILDSRKDEAEWL
jgi:ribosomal 50S subunit-recycling heat shock protein